MCNFLPLTSACHCSQAAQISCTHCCRLARILQSCLYSFHSDCPLSVLMVTTVQILQTLLSTVLMTHWVRDIPADSGLREPILLGSLVSSSLASLACAWIILLKHQRSQETPAPMTFYMTATIVCDVALLSSMLGFAERATPLGAFVSRCCVHFVILATDSFGPYKHYHGSMRRFLDMLYGISDEVFLVWINTYIRRGYGAILARHDLPKLHEDLRSGHVRTSMLNAWAERRQYLPSPPSPPFLLSQHIALALLTLWLFRKSRSQRCVTVGFIQVSPASVLLGCTASTVCPVISLLPAGVGTTNDRICDPWSFKFRTLARFCSLPFCHHRLHRTRRESYPTCYTSICLPLNFRFPPLFTKVVSIEYDF